MSLLNPDSVIHRGLVIQSLFSTNPGLKLAYCFGLCICAYLFMYLKTL
jgi:hypothetical protein